MKPVLLIDFGSTYTKLTAVDVEGERILGTAQSYTTVQTDINDGLEKGLQLLEAKPENWNLRKPLPVPLPRVACVWWQAAWCRS